jgi:hypothetical protein
MERSGSREFPSLPTRAKLRCDRKFRDASLCVVKKSCRIEVGSTAYRLMRRFRTPTWAEAEKFRRRQVAEIDDMVVSLVGLAVALRWELTGAAMTLVAVLIGAVVNWKVLSFPANLIPIVAVLFLSCCWISRGRRDDKAATSPKG